MKKAISIIIILMLVLTGFTLINSISAENTIDKTFSPEHGELGDVVTVTVEINVDTDYMAYFNDWLPNELKYYGNFKIDGVTETPTYYDEHYVGYLWFSEGTYTIEFDVKIVEAKSWEELQVNNVVRVYWLSTVHTSYWRSFDEIFTIDPFEELDKFIDGPHEIPLETDQHWEMTIEIDETPIAMYDAVISDRLGGDIEIDDQVSITGDNWDKLETWTKGKTEKVFLEWDVGDLNVGGSAQLVLEISPDMNTGNGNGKNDEFPDGHQEYTSSGWHTLNSGATLKFYDEDSDQLSAYTNSIQVLAYKDKFTVDSSIIDGYDFTGKKGKTYNFLVTGTWFNDGENAVDAEYTSNDDWATYIDGAPPANVNQFDLQIDETFVDWGIYNDNHYYCYYDYIAPSNTINFRVFEGNTITNTPNTARYSNNIGQLTVYIF